MRKETKTSRAAFQRHFAQRRAELNNVFQRAQESDLLSRDLVNTLGAIICGDATIDYLVLGTPAVVAEQYAALAYERIQTQQSVWPFTNKNAYSDPKKADPVKAYEQYCTAYEAYLQKQTGQALLQFYKDQYLFGRAYIAMVGAYLFREEKNEKKRERARPHWKVLWQDLKNQKHIAPLTQPEFKELLATQKTDAALRQGYEEIWIAGKRARDILETKFYSFAKVEARKFQRGGIDMNDLVQEAMSGIKNTVDRYDYKRGILFSTYAKWWTLTKLRRFTEKCDVHLPRYMKEATITLNAIEKDFERKSGREPSPTELLHELCTYGYTLEVAKEVLSSRQPPLSLDHEVMEDGSTLHEILSTTSELDPFETISRKRTAEEVRRAVALLEPRLRMVIEWRYHLNEIPIVGRGKNDCVSLTALGKLLAQTEGKTEPYCRERIRQLEARALKELREILMQPEFGYVHTALEQIV